MLLTSEQAGCIREKIEVKAEPWYAAFQVVKKEADSLLDTKNLSIIQCYNSRYFKQDAAYIPGKDGQVNPESNFKASQTARELGRRCLLWATMWELTGEEKYADRALAQIHAWTINEATYMMPLGCVPEGVNPDLAPSGDIQIFVSFDAFFLACAVMNAYPGWDAAPKKAVKKWVDTMMASKRSPMFHDGKMMYNNWEGARLLYLANGALFTGDNELLVSVFDRWQEIIPQMMTAEGALPRETERTRSMHYTLGAITELVQVAETARFFGRDLYGYTKDGKNIRLALDYAVGFLPGLEEWTYKNITPLEDDFHGPKFNIRTNALFELAYSQWQDTRYVHILNEFDARTGPGAVATLRYADRFALT